MSQTMDKMHHTKQLLTQLQSDQSYFINSHIYVVIFSWNHSKINDNTNMFTVLVQLFFNKKVIDFYYE